MNTEKTILILDDEETVRDSLSIFFQDEGYTVFKAENGDKGLEIFDENPADVVITDLRMPGKSGFDVLEAVQERRPGTPVLVISGMDDSQNIIKALRLGAKDYITKPVQDMEMIVHSVEQAVEAHRLSRENRSYRKALEKSEHQYRTIAENIAEGVFTVNKNDRITYVNDAFSTMTGHTREDLLKKSLKDLATEESIKAFQEQALNQEPGRTNRFEIQLVNGNQEPMHVELACNPIFSGSDRYQGFIAVARDITELTRMREKYKQFLSQSKSAATDVVSICASCKAIKQTETEWVSIENHFSDLMFSHGICPDCCEKLYPQFDFSELEKASQSDQD